MTSQLKQIENDCAIEICSPNLKGKAAGIPEASFHHPRFFIASRGVSSMVITLAVMVVAGIVGTSCFGIQTGELSNPVDAYDEDCLLYTSPSPRDKRQSRMPSSA